MENRTVKQLRDIAKERNLHGCWKFRKKELINFICQNEPKIILNFIDEDETPISTTNKQPPIPAPRTKKQPPVPRVIVGNSYQLKKKAKSSRKARE